MISNQEEKKDFGEGELNWAEREFVGANLGDKRLKKRMVAIANAFMNRPEAAIPQATGDWAGAKGAYRFFDHPKVNMEKILEPHRETTGNRIKGKTLVLAVQDTSFIDYTDHPATEGLSLLSDEDHQGLIIHPTLAVNEDGVPLGLIDIQMLDRETIGAKEERKLKRTEDKESRKWLESYRATVKFAQGKEGTHFVNVGDRESDIYDYFLEALEQKQKDRNAPDVLVRAATDRCLEEDDGHLWMHMESQPVSGRVIIEVPRKDKQPARKAHLTIRYAPVNIKPPTHRKKEKDLKPLELWAVYAHEERPPKGIEAISWMLLTTLPIFSLDEAFEKLRWYTLRWVIEMYFKVLKSGCKIEERQLEAAHRLKSCLAMDSIIAWRILFLTMIGRKMPDLPASILFEDYEWKALYCYLNETTETPPKEPLLGEVMRQISKLGGFLDRRHDGDPGSMCLWRGMWRLTDIAGTWKIFNKPQEKTYG